MSDPLQHRHHVDVHVHVHGTQHAGIEQQLTAILRELGILKQQGDAMATDLTALKDAVAQVKGNEASMKEAIVQIASLVTAQTAKIQELIDAAGAGGVDPTELQAIVDDTTATATALAADKQAIVDAVNANPVP